MLLKSVRIILSFGYLTWISAFGNEMTIYLFLWDAGGLALNYCYYKGLKKKKLLPFRLHVGENPFSLWAETKTVLSQSF